MNREQIQKLAKKFTVKTNTRQKIIKPNSISISDTNVVNVALVEEVINQAQCKAVTFPRDVYKFDIQLDKFLGIFPENQRLNLASKLLEIFEVKTSKEVGSNNPSTTIIDNKIKLFEALYLMHVNKEFNWYILPDTILFRFSKVLCNLAERVNFIKKNAIPERFGISEYIKFMYVIIGKLIEDYSDVKKENLAIDKAEKLMCTSNEVEVDKPNVSGIAPTIEALSVPVIKEEPEEPEESEVQEVQEVAGTKDNEILKELDEIFENWIDKKVLDKKIESFIEINPKDKKDNPLILGNMVKVWWDRDLPELQGLQRNKYSIEFLPVTTNYVVNSLEISLREDIGKIFNDSKEIIEKFARIRVGQIIANHEVIGYHYLSKPATYAEYVANSKTDNNFRKRGGLTLKCLSCGTIRDLSIHVLIQRIRVSSGIGCGTCAISIATRKQNMLYEILRCFESHGIKPKEMMVKNIGEFSLKRHSLIAASNMTAKCMGCRKPVQIVKNKSLLFSQGDRFNCNEKCSPYSDGVYKLFYYTRIFKYKWSDSESENIAVNHVAKFTEHMLANPNPNAPIGYKPMIGMNEKVSNEKDNLSKDYTPISTPTPILQVLKKDEPKVEKPVENKVTEVAGVIMENDSFTNLVAQEAFFKHFKKPGFGFKIFAFIPELGLYSGMIKGDNRNATMVANWKTDGKLDSLNIEDVKKYSFTKKENILISNNDIINAVNDLWKFGANPLIPNGEIEESKIMELKIKIAELITEAIDQNK